MGPSVQPSGSIDTEDRRIIAYNYSGLATAAPVISGDRIVEPVEAVLVRVRPVQVEPIDVLQSIAVYLGGWWHGQCARAWA